MITMQDAGGYYALSRAVGSDKRFDIALMLIQNGSPWRPEDLTTPSFVTKVRNFIDDFTNIPKALREYFKSSLERKLIFAFVCGEIENYDIYFHNLMNFKMAAANHISES